MVQLFGNKARFISEIMHMFCIKYQKQKLKCEFKLLQNLFDFMPLIKSLKLISKFAVGPMYQLVVQLIYIFFFFLFLIFSSINNLSHYLQQSKGLSSC